MVSPAEEDILQRFRTDVGRFLSLGRPGAVHAVIRTSYYWTVPRCRAVACILAGSPFQSHQEEALEILDGIDLYQRTTRKEVITHGDQEEADAQEGRGQEGQVS